MLDMVLCSCGSGLRKIRCCGLDPAALPALPSLEVLQPLAAEATRHFNEKRRPEAEALACKLLDLAPNHRAALRVLYELRKAENRQPAVEMLARRLAELPTDNMAQLAAANLQLAQLLIGQNRHGQAEVSARVALKAAPNDPTPHHVLGVIFTETQRAYEGELHYRKAAGLREQTDGMLLGNLAWNLKLQGRLVEAAETYATALALRPDNRRAIGGYAQVETARGEAAHAATLLDEALTRFADDRTLRLLRALLDLTRKQPQAVLERLDIPAETLLPAELIARGQAFMQLGQTADAIAAIVTARRMQRERFAQRYEPAPFIAKAETYKAFFTSAKFSPLPRAAPILPPQPIFLLGFPGSGTALLEQLLAQVPGIAAGGDFLPVADLLNLPELELYPECLSDMLVGDGGKRLARIGRVYLESMEAAGLLASADDFITHRAASNFWHLGLIKLLFPQAPVLHLIRHPLDVVLSNFTHDKKLEGNCTVSLGALAQHYSLTMSMIRHYRGQLTLRYLPLRYEDLVTQPAQSLSKLLDFIGTDAALPDAAELRANQRVATARVPGHAIAQAPVHAGAVFRHLEFEAAAPGLFAEARPILQPWIEELGYGP